MSEPLYGVAFVIEAVEMGRKVAGSGLSDDEIESLSMYGLRTDSVVDSKVIEKEQMDRKDNNIEGDEEKRDDEERDDEERDDEERDDEEREEVKEEEEGEKETDKEKDGEKEKEKESNKGDLLLGKLISDSIEAFRLAFLSCPVS